MNKIMTVKFEKDIGISDEEKNKLRYTLVLHFMEQLKQKGMYKVEEEKHDGKWVISASLVMPTIEAEPVKQGRWEVNGDRCYPFCSNCKYEPPKELIRCNALSLEPILTRYCPNCGSENGTRIYKAAKRRT